MFKPSVYFAIVFFILGGLFQPSIAAKQRIISLAPNLTEIVYAIGAGNELVAVSADSNYPKQALSLPRVANARQLDLEKIVALQPTMILAWKGGNSAEQLATLKRLHIPVHSFSFHRISDITAAIKKIGELTSHQQKADEVVTKFSKQIAAAKVENEVQKHPSVFYVIWQKPLITVGNNTLINNAIKFCGGVNVFGNLSASAPKVSFASVLKKNPKIIISGINNPNWKTFWLKWPQLTAVSQQHLDFINPSLLQRPGPRFADGLTQLCKIIAKA